MKNFIVIFTSEGAKISKDPEVIEKYKDKENILINPKIPDGEPPHLWIKDGDEIKVSGKDEIKTRTNKIKRIRTKAEIYKFEIIILRILLTLSILGNIIHVFS